jgi:hypothetical protein
MAFAAARLAKDTQVTSEGILVTKNDEDQVVGIHVESKIFDLIEDDERRLELVDHTDGTTTYANLTAAAETGFISFSDATELYERCQDGDPSYIRHACADYINTVPICGAGISSTSGQKATGNPRSYTWKYLDGDIVVGECPSTIHVMWSFPQRYMSAVVLL